MRGSSIKLIFKGIKKWRATGRYERVKGGLKKTNLSNSVRKSGGV